ncbi:hypothetical protein ALI22I_40705 [Saccharothrix sp. ALI-22-I]|uniref:hypothetical protein n=1 Tax=Saccharothrix sp. ALI-22-I TaxID=1933778 RepID=UPI00097C2AD1|nr:hypothetical protein [Saccharothrix sp. ALI-22-I]ONI82416.1 hypothetical protein ALI22I_40705 [Saccharothrix sp. ALI-22-I]
MGQFFAAALGFPVVVLTVLLVIVIVYWLLVAVGVADADWVELDIGGAPVTVGVSLLIAFSWFASLAGTVLFTPSSTLVGAAVLAGALVVGLVLTRLIMTPLKRLFPADLPASRLDFVGRPCVIRTGRVTRTFGQAEVTAADGSSALVQVRQPGQDPMTAGTTALIFDYDADGEFFWVASLEIGHSPTLTLGDH